MRLTKGLQLKLAQMLLKFGQVETQKGETLTFEGDLETGKEIYISSDKEEPAAAPDGEYETADKIITVSGGMIEDIRDKDDKESASVEVENSAEAVATIEQAIELLADVVGKLSGNNVELSKRLASLESKFSKAVRGQARPVDNRPAKDIRFSKNHAKQRLLDYQMKMRRNTR